MYKIEILKTGPRRLAGLPHHGACYRIGDTMAKLDAVMTAKPATVVAAYYDSPMVTAEADLKSFAGVAIGWKRPLPAGMQELRLPGGRCAVLHHTDPYETLPAAWTQLMNHMQETDEAAAAAPPCEIYRNTQPGDLKTDIFWPLA